MNERLMKNKIQQLINLPLSEVENNIRWGVIPEQVGRAYWSVWEWSAVRFSGRAGDKHEWFYARFGPEAYYRRINKVRAAFGLATLWFLSNPQKEVLI